MEATVFSHENCELGESPLWSPERHSLFWVDINRKLVFEKALESSATHYDACWQFTATPTALARHPSDGYLWVITDGGLMTLDLTTGAKAVAVPYSLPDGIRTNDAGVGPDRKLWIGTMQRTPTSPTGNVFSIDADGDVTQEAESITIPNTFCWSPDGSHCYLTDSFERTVYRPTFPGEIAAFKQHPWQQGESEAITFDGGAVDQQGRLWIARWGGGRIDQFESTGHLREQVTLPALLPSSCCFGGHDNRSLYITTAMEGLSVTQRQASPDAGKVFVVECSEPGEDIPRFHIHSS